MKKNKIDLSKMPPKMAAYEWADEMVDFLFPVRITEAIAQEREAVLREKLFRLLQPLRLAKPHTADAVVASLFSQLDAVYEALLADAELFVRADPASESIEEVITAYPGFYAIAIYRLAHILYQLKVPILPRVISEYAHRQTGIDIHPGAHIGVPFFIDHGTGVVVGQTTVIGKNVKMYQGVTLGALAVRKEEKGAKRHPTIEDNVILYAGSCILGGDTVIGHDSVVGGNVWLTESIPPFSIVYHVNQVKVRDKSEMQGVINFII